MKVEIMESSIVRPVDDTPKHHLWLSNIDLLVPRVHVPTVYLYKSNGRPNFFEAKVLMEAMAKLVVPFYPVAGRLGTDESGRIQINCNGEGVLFVQARTDSSLQDFGDFTPDSEEMKHLIPYVDYSTNISSYPLLQLQVTYLKCGGVCLGVGWHHMLFDGTCAIPFINMWSDMARGLSITITASPFIDRAILKARDPPTPKFNHTEYHKPPSMNIPPFDRKPTSTSTSTSTAIFKISIDQLNTLKAKANSLTTNNKFSTFEVLTAHVWRCICKSRDLADDQATALYIPTDGRRRMRPPLPPACFANVVFANNLVALSGEVKVKPLADTAGRIHEAIRRRDDEYLRSSIDYLEVQADLGALRRGADTFACPNLNVSSWMRTPLYDADFGWGGPVHAGVASVVYEGNMFVLPASTKDGSLSLALCLQTHHMERFRTCFYDF